MVPCMTFVNILLYFTFYTPLYFLYTRDVPRPLTNGFKFKHVIV